MKAKPILSIILRLVAAIIMLQSLYFKFSAQPESIMIFSQLGVEPWGRIGTGIAELIASILLLAPRTVVVGATLGAGVMLGAIASHLFIIGVQIQGDGGLLFFYAFVVLLACVGLLFIHVEQLISYRKRLSR